MTDVDLTFAREIVEDLMAGDEGAECRITRDPEHTSDDTWDDVTGTAGRPPDDTNLVYEGPCLFRTDSQPAVRIEGGAVQEVSEYILKIPVPALTVGEPAPGDQVAITASRNPGDLELRLRVREARHKTFAVSRELLCETRERSGDRP